MARKIISPAHFYKILQVGQIVHYNAFAGRAFYRCKAVIEKGEKMLLPIALVGQWHQCDLPHYVQGKPHNGYHAEKIINGDTFHPHVSGIYEAGYKSPIDPRNLPAIDLTLPTQTEGQKKEAAGWEQIKIIKDYLDAPKETDPWVILANVRNLV